MAKEVGWKWAGFSMVFSTGLAYTVAVVLYQTLRMVA